MSRDEDTKRFRLGIAAFRLGERARASTDLRNVALPVLKALAAETGETALLTVLDTGRDRALCLERIESDQPLRLSVQPGRVLPLHAGASQKILLAFMPQSEIQPLLLGPLPRLHRATIVDPKLLRAELKEIRERGYAISVEETNAGVWGMAVPILDGDGQIVAGLGFAGPLARRRDDLAAHQLNCLNRGARAITKALGIGAVGQAAQVRMNPTGTEG